MGFPKEVARRNRVRTAMGHVSRATPATAAEEEGADLISSQQKKCVLLKELLYAFPRILNLYIRLAQKGRGTWFEP